MRDHVLFLTDLHFWEVVLNPFRQLNKRLLGNANVALKRRHHFPMANARPFADLALASGARDVIIGGDVTSTSTEREFRLASEFVDELAERGARIEIVPGNHDVYTFAVARQRTFERWFERHAPEEGYPARRTLPGGTPVILVSSVRPNWLASSGRIEPETLASVERLLSECEAEQVLVVGHYPLLDNTTEYVMGPSRHCEGSADFRAMLGRSGKRILHVAGHVHRFSLIADPDHENVRHVTGPSFFNHWPKADREGGYLELECLDDGVRVRHHFKSAAGWDSQTFEPGESPHSTLAT
ncbi:MAG: metallophosphoesterase family protein [Planctomycetota bacterium]